MGRGIASISLDLAEVVLEDVREESLDAARKEIAGGFRKRVASGALRDIDAGARSARLLTASSLERLAGCDLVIEAIFEDLNLKRELFAEIEKHVGPQTVLASNTSALPISSVARCMPITRLPSPLAPRMRVLARSSGFPERGSCGR